MYVERVEGNVKGKVNAELGRLTLIVGPNGSGKSRLINTLELALLGYASDVVGRAEVRKEAELVALGGGAGVNAKATLNDGRVCAWETEKTKIGAKRAQHIKSVSAQFPVSEIRDALTGSVDTARKWLLQRIAATVSRSDVTRYLLSDETLALYEAKAKWALGSEVDVLLAVYESAKTEKRTKSAQLTTTGKSIATLADGLPPEPTEAQLDAGKQAADVAMTAYREAVEANARASVAPTRQDPRIADALYARAVELAGLVEKAAREREGAHVALTALGGPLDASARTVHDLRVHVIDLCEMQAHAGAGACLSCEQPYLAAHAAQRAATLAQRNAAMTSREAAAVALEACADGERKLREAFDRAAADYTHAKASAAAYVPPDASLAEAVNAAAMGLRAANEANAAIQRTTEGWKSVRSLKQEEREAKKAIETLEELIEGCKSAVDGILKSATRAFVAKVQSFLPATDAFDLVLTDGERDVCRFGFVRRGELHTALSGAEWARLTLALACAAADEAPDVLRVFVPEDRAFDAATLRDVLLALANAPGQVIIATTTRPAGRLPKGWTLIETGFTE